MFLDYRKGDGTSGLEDAVHTLCRGAEFAEAYRLVSLAAVLNRLPKIAENPYLPQTALHDRHDLIESLIYTGLEDAQETLMDVFSEMDGQLSKELRRIQELVGTGGKMETDPGSYAVFSLGYYTYSRLCLDRRLLHDRIRACIGKC